MRPIDLICEVWGIDIRLFVSYGEVLILADIVDLFLVSGVNIRHSSQWNFMITVTIVTTVQRIDLGGRCWYRRPLLTFESF